MRLYPIDLSAMQWYATNLFGCIMINTGTEGGIAEKHMPFLLGYMTLIKETTERFGEIT